MVPEGEYADLQFVEMDANKDDAILVDDAVYTGLAILWCLRVVSATRGQPDRCSPGCRGIDSVARVLCHHRLSTAVVVTVLMYRNVNPLAQPTIALWRSPQ